MAGKARWPSQHNTSSPDTSRHLMAIGFGLKVCPDSRTEGSGQRTDVDHLRRPSKSRDDDSDVATLACTFTDRHERFPRHLN